MGDIHINIRDDKVELKTDDVSLIMSAKLARELGDKLYRAGCDVQAVTDSQA